MSIEVDITRLETGIRQLKIQYDMFFAGAIPLQPIELRGEIERLIRQNSTEPIQRYAHRFHFNSLVSRFNCLSELWGKTIRSREEGERPVPAAANLRDTRPFDPDRCTISDPEKETKQLRKLHTRYLAQRCRAEGKTPNIPFEKFVKGITAQADRLRKKTACKKIELRIIVEDGKVHLKARARKS